MTIISNITLLVVALFTLCIMLRLDINAHRQCDHSNSRYYAWLKKNDEYMTPKRLIVIAVLVGCCTTMAQSSWIVVMILAATLIALGIVLLCKKPDKPQEVEDEAANDEATVLETPSKFSKRQARIYYTAIIIALILVELACFVGSRQNETIASQAGATFAVTLLAISPALTMLANLLLQPVEKWINDKE